VIVDAADGVEPADAHAAVEAALADWPGVEVQDRAEVRASLHDDVAAMLNLVYGLLGLAVVIALLGIANTLALAVHERTTEIGLLRAVGMQRGQLRAALRWEAVVIAVLGATLGTGLAVIGATLLVTNLDGEQARLALPIGRLAAVVVVAAGAAVVAAAGPARRAARLDVLTAIAAER
jgi:putative ABC transport system permease protein